MGNRTVPFSVGEYYHCYNRGVDKRNVFADKSDFEYFLKMLLVFNQKESLGNMPMYMTEENRTRFTAGDTEPLVTIHAYCLNPNHYHLLLSQHEENGISKFMQKIGTGYTMYFNQKNDRTGALFQGKFKASHVNSDQYLRRILAYVTLNNVVHNIRDASRYRNSFDLLRSNDKARLLDRKLAHETFGKKNLAAALKREVQATITYRESLESPEKSELLE